MKLEIIKKVYGVIILVVTLPFGLIVFCLGSVLSSFISLVVNTHYTGRLIHLGFLMQLKDLAPTFFLSLMTFVISWSLTQIVSNIWLQLVLGGIAGSVFYIGVAWLLKMNQLSDIKYLFSR